MNGNIQYLYNGVSINLIKNSSPYMDEHFLTYNVFCIQNII
jgi:hypothetical protein